MTIKVKKTQGAVKSSEMKTSRKQPVKAAQNHDEAIQYIRSAINVLCKCAESGDSVAKDSIANLGVVLFDLQ